ncbi:hypothetical protein D3C79_692810 [compost metagenome]
MAIRAPVPVATGSLPRATGLPMVIITVAAGNVLVIPLARRLGLAHFVARVERAPRSTLTLHLLATFTVPLAGPFSQGPKADAQTQ